MWKGKKEELSMTPVSHSGCKKRGNFVRGERIAGWGDSKSGALGSIQGLAGIATIETYVPGTQNSRERLKK